MRGFGRASPPFFWNLHVMSPQYQLSPYVFACTTGRHCMFLDLLHDRYLSVPQPLMQLLAPRIQGWMDKQAAPAAISPSSEEVDQLADDLVCAGVLTPYLGNYQSRVGRPPHMHSDFRSLIKNRRIPRSRSSSISAITALAFADFSLRSIPLWRVIRAITNRSRNSTPRTPEFFTANLSTLLVRFQEIRPWYPRNYLCLFDSFALTIFLQSHGISTQWTFGVREDPFGAHCWVQYGTVVLNDYIDRTQIYTPIMWI